MAGAQVGLGTATFGTVFVGVFDAEAGFTMDLGSIPEVNVQTDTDTNITYCAGDSIDFGQFSASIQIADGVDVSAIVRTTETLTVTLPNGDNYSGQAFSLVPVLQQVLILKLLRPLFSVGKMATHLQRLHNVIVCISFP